MMHVDAVRLGLRRRFRHEARGRRAERQRRGTANQKRAAIEARLVDEAAIAKR